LKNTELRTSQLNFKDRKAETFIILIRFVSFVSNFMTLKQIGDFILKELSAGNFIQNIGFYTVLVLLAWIITTQFSEISHKYRVN
jgi:hypothetical protein